MYIDEIKLYIRDEDIIEERDISFPTRLQELLDEKNITQKQLANDIGISEKTISEWKTKKAIPKDTTLDLLSNYFNKSKDYLLCKDNTEFEDILKFGNLISNDYRNDYFDSRIKILEAFGYEIRLFDEYVVPTKKTEKMVEVNYADPLTPFEPDPDLKEYMPVIVEEEQDYRIEEILYHNKIYKFKYYPEVHRILIKAEISTHNHGMDIKFDFTYEELLNIFKIIDNYHDELFKKFFNAKFISEDENRKIWGFNK